MGVQSHLLRAQVSETRKEEPLCCGDGPADIKQKREIQAEHCYELYTNIMYDIDSRCVFSNTASTPAGLTEKD